MRCIALTGGIATGKSTVARMLEDRGAAVVDADSVAREVVHPGGAALSQIRDRFGSAVVSAEGTLDRSALGEIVFGDGTARRDLEAITHPRISALLKRRVAAARTTGAPLTVVDVPLLFETGTDVSAEGILLVVASEEVQLARLMARDPLTEEQARLRIAAQMPLAEKLARATWVIDNGGGRDATGEQVDRWWAAVVAQDQA